MTNEIIDAIRKLHYQDVNIKSIEIANILGITQTTVFNYRPKVKIMDTCCNPKCNNTFYRIASKKYCSPECRPHYVKRTKRIVLPKHTLKKKQNIIDKYSIRLNKVWKDLV